jgi:hypothetical protein
MFMYVCACVLRISGCVYIRCTSDHDHSPAEEMKVCWYSSASSLLFSLSLSLSMCLTHLVTNVLRLSVDASTLQPMADEISQVASRYTGKPLRLSRKHASTEIQL